MAPSEQGQHRISQVYLKQFGYRHKGKTWKISVLKMGPNDPYTKVKSIKGFTKETNIFDISILPIDNPVRRYFESNCQKLETHYPKVINHLEEKNFLNSASINLLHQFIPSILCRSVPFRELLKHLLKKETREALFKEITTFEPDDDQFHFLSKMSPSISLEDQLNIIIGNVMSHLIRVFKAFSFVVFKSFEEKIWFTTDNPVLVDNKGDYSHLIAVNAEIFFPLSKDYLLVLYNPNIKDNTWVKTHDHSKVYPIDSKTHDDLLYRYTLQHRFQYLIFPFEQERIDIRMVNRYLPNH